MEEVRQTDSTGTISNRKSRGIYRENARVSICTYWRFGRVGVVRDSQKSCGWHIEQYLLYQTRQTMDILAERKVCFCHLRPVAIISPIMDINPVLADTNLLHGNMIPPANVVHAMSWFCSTAPQLEIPPCMQATIFVLYQRAGFITGNTYCNIKEGQWALTSRGVIDILTGKPSTVMQEVVPGIHSP